MARSCAPVPARGLHERVVHRGGPMKARVAVAREMLAIAWHMLKNDCPYEEREPSRRPGRCPLITSDSTSSGKLGVPQTH